MRALQQPTAGSCRHLQQASPLGHARHLRMPSSCSFVNSSRGQSCSHGHDAQPCLASMQPQHASALQRASSRPPYRSRPVAAVSTAATAAATPATAAGPADPCLNLQGAQARAVGALLGSMCGNALGAQVEPEKHYRITRLFPEGYSDMSWSYDISPNPLPAGHVTGDFVTMLAVAWSLARQQQADAFDVLDCLASSYSPEGGVRYSPYTALALEGLASGTNPFMLAHHVEGYMAVTPSRASKSCSHRPDRQLHGTQDFTAVIRAVPVGLAYRDAPQEALCAAVDAVVAFTHPTEQGSAGAAAVAAAVAWLARSDPATATPEQLLAHLLDINQSPDMAAKLLLLQQRLPALRNLGAISNWSQFWQSGDWNNVSSVANLLCKANLAMQGTQAAALALWVLLVSWQHPKQAVMLAASLGGYAGTTGALVGAMAGALHGCEWIPKHWWDQLQEDGEQEAEVREQGDGEDEASNDGEDKEAAGDAAAGSGGTSGAQATAAAAAAAVAAAGGGGDGVVGAVEDDALSELRVGKYAVVLLGHELAALSCQQAPQLF